MPSPYAELIERSYRAFREDDLPTLLAAYHPDAVWDMTNWEGFPDANIYRGRSGIEEVLFVRGGMSIRGKSSGVEVGVPPFAQVFEFRDNLIARADAYSDLEAGRRAAGLTDD